MEQNKLKNQLFKQLKGLGIHEELKKQIRIQLCEKLKARDLIRKEQSHDDKLYNRIMASLISEELSINDCGYSNSIYAAESGYDGKLLSRQQMLQIMNMCDEDVDKKHSILSNLMKRKYPFNGNTIRAVSIQTSPEEIGYTLEQRLALIDQQFRKNITDKQQNNDPLALRSEYNRNLQKLQAELKRTFERDVQRFKQFEAHSIKVKISQQWTQKFQDYARTIEQTYSRKMDTLRKRERMLEEDLINRNKVLDQKIAQTTKTLRNKVDLLDIKNGAVDETHKNLQIERKRTKEQLDLRQKQLKKKMKEYDDLLLNLNKKIQYEVGVAKLAIQQEYQQKQSEFFSRKKFIDEEYGKLMGIKQSCDIVKQQNKRLFDENTRLRKDLTQIEQQLRLSISENGSKGDRIENLKAEINQLNHKKQSIAKELDQQIKKRKRNEKSLIQLRKQIEQLRNWKQRNQEQQLASSKSEIIDQNTNANKFNSQLARKLQNIKQERKKQIQKFRLQF